MSNTSYRNVDISPCPGEVQDIPAAQICKILTSSQIVTSSMTSDLSLWFEATNVVLGVGEEILVYLQQQIRQDTGVPIWIDVGPVACVNIDADGTYGILLHSDIPAEAEYLPLAPLIRLVIDTGATSTVSLGKITLGKKGP